VFYVGGNVLEVTPPLTISDAEIDLGVSVLAEAIADAVHGRVDLHEVARYAGW
jgi:4-aminobutyrate aminotransferase